MSKIKSKQVTDTIVIMSRMDYEIAKRVYEAALAIHLADEELSFLMGKRNKYFFDLLNPTEKDKIKTEHLDILPTILQLHIRDIIPNDIKPGEQIKIRASKSVSITKIVYKHSVIFQNGDESEPIIWKKKLVMGERRKLNENLHKAILKLADAGYFDQPKNALELSIQLRKDKTLLFKPADLQKSLAVMMNKKRNEPVRLECKTDNARYSYIKEHSNKY